MLGVVVACFDVVVAFGSKPVAFIFNASSLEIFMQWVRGVSLDIKKIHEAKIKILQLHSFLV